MIKTTICRHSFRDHGIHRMNKFFSTSERWEYSKCFSIECYHTLNLYVLESYTGNFGIIALYTWNFVYDDCQRCIFPAFPNNPWFHQQLHLFLRGNLQKENQYLGINHSGNRWFDFPNRCLLSLLWNCWGSWPDQRRRCLWWRWSLSRCGLTFLFSIF